MVVCLPLLIGELEDLSVFAGDKEGRMNLTTTKATAPRTRTMKAKGTIKRKGDFLGAEAAVD